MHGMLSFFWVSIPCITITAMIISDIYCVVKFRELANLFSVHDQCVLLLCKILTVPLSLIICTFPAEQKLLAILFINYSCLLTFLFSK